MSTTQNLSPFAQKFLASTQKDRWLCCKNPANSVGKAVCMQSNLSNEKECKKCLHERCDDCLPVDGKEPNMLRSMEKWYDVTVTVTVSEANSRDMPIYVQAVRSVKLPNTSALLILQSIIKAQQSPKKETALLTSRVPRYLNTTHFSCLETSALIATMKRNAVVALVVVPLVLVFAGIAFYLCYSIMNTPRKLSRLVADGGETGGAGEAGKPSQADPEAGPAN
ncbi:hypothetical protein VTL71DRAFT_2153 [Oculimacula yallundae]|uniref:Uncharacterized protein n=1 Tax=Oculimacula yallundae TaxID=86028 RepID=A0ABR4C825_9HELO